MMKTIFQWMFFFGDLFEFFEICKSSKVKGYGTENYEFDGYIVFLIIMMIVGVACTLYV